jgi:type III pantothenate kinase
MMLLVDLGNSRVKWAELEDDRLGPQRAAAYHDWSSAAWRRELFGSARPARVVACSVASEAVRAQVDAAAFAATGRNVEWIFSTAAAAGVTNGYRNPAQLGVDRWVAVIGAYRTWSADCCVIDVGTAMTVDVVTAAGRHRGGLIVPGPTLMIEALHAQTSDLAARSAASADPARSAFADQTRDAIENGCELALAALAERACRAFELEVGVQPRLVFTGGAAARVRSWVTLPSDDVPDLVLRGLSIIATSSGQS